MPTIGEQIKGNEIGYEASHSSAKILFVWVRCPMCTEERWARKRSSINPVNNVTRLCSPCAVKHAKNFRLNSERAAIEGRI